MQPQDIVLEDIVQADFSRCIVNEQAVSVLAFTYLKYLSERDQLKFLTKTLKFGLDFIAYTATRCLNRENLEYAYAQFSGCPIELLDYTAGILTPNTAFFDTMNSCRKDESRIALNIITRDSRRVVESYISSHKNLFDSNNILIGSIFANELCDNSGVLTGKSVINVTLMNKTDYINPDHYYICASDEFRLYSRNISRILSV